MHHAEKMTPEHLRDDFFSKSHVVDEDALKNRNNMSEEKIKEKHIIFARATGIEKEVQKAHKRGTIDIKGTNAEESTNSYKPVISVIYHVSCRLLWMGI